jgi:hypothetical protein
VKKMLFGVVLLLCGITWMVVLTALSVVHPWDYNGITGLYGFLLGSKTIYVFILATIMSVTGLGICFYEAYIRKLE